MTITLRYSGGSTNQFASSSIGGLMSDTAIPNNSLKNLFDNVTRVEVINGRTEYRLFYIYNPDATKHFQMHLKNIAIPVDTEISFAVDESSSPQVLASEDQVPSGLTFLKYDEWDNLIVPIGHLLTLTKIPIWVKRKVTQGSSATRTISFDIDAETDSLVISQDFDTVENIFDNHVITPRSSEFLVEEDKVGEVLLS